jgi:hypothetical protein
MGWGGWGIALCRRIVLPHNGRGKYILALISGAYEVASFFGFPPYANNPYTKTVAFLVFTGAISRIIATQRGELERLRHSDVEFDLEPKCKLQRDHNAWDAVHSRIAVTNTSQLISVKDIQLVIEEWDFSAASLNSDTALAVKDGNGDTSVTIPPEDTKQFNLFISVLKKGTDNVSHNLVCSPNDATMDSTVGGFHVNLRLIGEKIRTRHYKVLLTVAPDKN